MIVAGPDGAMDIGHDYLCFEDFVTCNMLKSLTLVLFVALDMSMHT